MDELVIKEYFNLDRTIKHLKNHKDNLHQEFYHRSMTTRIEYNDLGIVSRGFRPDSEVVNLYDRIDVVERRIERNSYRLKHFNAYLKRLPSGEVYGLKRKYMGYHEVHIKEETLQKILTEIGEIETAVCFREGIEPEPEQVRLCGDVMADIYNMAEVFAL